MSIRINKLANVMVPAADQDQMLAFYTEMLGLEKRVDAPFGEGNRWIEVAPSNADTSIALAPPGPNGSAGGKDTGITLETSDVDAFHAELKDRGVDVDPAVSRFDPAVPALFWFRDPEANVLMAVQAQ